MPPKIKLFLQKRVYLKSQIDKLTNLLDTGTVDNIALKLRSARLSEIYHDVENQSVELMTVDPRDVHVIEFDDIQERFYALITRIEGVLHATNTSEASTRGWSEGTQSDSATTREKQRRMKLPDAKLPTFDGQFENWISFKNAFKNMVDSRTELSDVDKLQYLQSALIGEAANKINIFAVDGANYSKAWEMLVRAYEVKRLLISRHLSLILNLPVLDKETSTGFMKLADDAQQHVASLASLGMTIAPETIVRVLETKLPKSAADRWETGIERDEMPSPEQMYEFLYKAAVHASKRERARTAESTRGANETPAKRRRVNSSNRALLLNTSALCPACETKQHPLFACEKFKQLPVPSRIEIVKNAKLCFNCMRSHRGKPCGFSTCTICKRRHNSLLHLEQRAIATRSAAIDTKSDLAQSVPNQ